MKTKTRRAYTTAPAKTGEKQGNRGRFQPGRSGNPRGRPQGSRHKATIAALELLAEDLENITAALVEKARAGEAWAIKLVMDKLIPNAKDQPVVFPLPRLEKATDLRAALVAILKAMSRGRLTPDQTRAIAEVVSACGVALAVEELEEQVNKMQGGHRCA